MSATHPFAPEDLMAFVDGELSSTEVTSVSAHIAVCVECADTVAQFRGVSEALARWEVPAAPAEMDAAIRAGIVRAGSGSPAVGTLAAVWVAIRSSLLPGALGAAAALVLLVVFLRTRTPAPAPVATREAPQSEQSYPPVPAMRPPVPEGGSEVGSLRTLSQANVRSTSTREEAASQSLRTGPGRLNEGSTQAGPMIARSVSLGVVVKDLDAARSALDGIIARRHGYSAELTESNPGGSGGTLHATVRVPVAELAGAVAEFKLLGRTLNESQSGEEVTQRHADLVQRLKTARDTEERFRAILQQRTGSIADVLEVEERIATVRGEIEGMEAEQKGLEHRVDYASIDLSLSQEYKMPLEAQGDSLGVRSHNALVAGYQNALGTVVGLALFIEEYGPALVVWVILLGVPVWLVRRRYRKGRG